MDPLERPAKLPESNLHPHPHVKHPKELLRLKQGTKSDFNKLQDWAANHLALFFGSMLTVELFLVYPLLALLFPQNVQTVVFFISSGWIQLWALPLLNYTQNKVQEANEAKQEVDHETLTYIATLEDQVKELIEINNKLTAEIHKHLITKSST